MVDDVANSAVAAARAYELAQSDAFKAQGEHKIAEEGLEKKRKILEDAQARVAAARARMVEAARKLVTG